MSSSEGQRNPNFKGGRSNYCEMIEMGLKQNNNCPAPLAWKIGGKRKGGWRERKSVLALPQCHLRRVEVIYFVLEDKKGGGREGGSRKKTTRVFLLLPKMCQYKGGKMISLPRQRKEKKGLFSV